MILLRFSRQPALSSVAIAWFTQGHYSHVDCMLPNGTALGSRSDRLGGIPSGVEIRPANYARFSLTSTFALNTTLEQESEFYKFLHEQIGKPYDYCAIWGFVAGRNWREADSWICSELQAALKLGRCAIGIELSSNYFRDGALYCETAARAQNTPTLFDLLATANEEAAA